MPTVRLASPLRRLTRGQAVVVVGGDDLRAVIANLDALHPGMHERLLDANGTLRRFVTVFVGDQDARSLGGLDTPVSGDDTISIVPAVAGGA